MNTPMLYCWTQTAGYSCYPAYLNATPVEGGVRIFVRAAEHTDNEGTVKGLEAAIVLPIDAWDELTRQRDLAAAQEARQAAEARAKQNARDAEKFRRLGVIGWCVGYKVTAFPGDGAKMPDNAVPVYVEESGQSESAIAEEPS